jgi:hypothetical protein
MSTPNVNNSRTRIWTKKELNGTVKEAKAGGFKILKDRDFSGQVLIYDETKDTHIVVAAPGPNNMMLCKVDLSYFGES